MSGTIGGETTLAGDDVPLAGTCGGGSINKFRELDFVWPDVVDEMGAGAGDARADAGGGGMAKDVLFPLPDAPPLEEDGGNVHVIGGVAVLLVIGRDGGGVGEADDLEDGRAKAVLGAWMGGASRFC